MFWMTRIASPWLPGRRRISSRRSVRRATSLRGALGTEDEAVAVDDPHRDGTELPRFGRRELERCRGAEGRLVEVGPGGLEHLHAPHGALGVDVDREDDRALAPRGELARRIRR